MAITQKGINYKIDIALLAALNEYCEENNLMRNRIINEAVAKYIGYDL
jgi:hypothetical protein